LRVNSKAPQRGQRRSLVLLLRRRELLLSWELLLRLHHVQVGLLLETLILCEVLLTLELELRSSHVLTHCWSRSSHSCLRGWVLVVRACRLLSEHGKVLSWSRHGSSDALQGFFVEVGTDALRDLVDACLHLLGVGGTSVHVQRWQLGHAAGASLRISQDASERGQLLKVRSVAWRYSRHMLWLRTLSAVKRACQLWHLRNSRDTSITASWILISSKR